MAEESVAYYEKRFGVSTKVARERLATQAMAPGVGDALARRWGDAIADVWFDNTTGLWVVNATASAPAEGIGSVFEDDGLTNFYRLERVAFTHAELLETSARLSEKLSDLVRRGLVRVGVGAGKVNLTLAADMNSTDRESAESAAGAAATGSKAPPVMRTTSPERSLLANGGVSCAFPYCDTLVGGDFYFANGVGCTMAFFGGLTLAPNTWQPVMLTADHCTQAMGGASTVVSSSNLTSTVAIGNTYNGQYGYGDWGYLYPYNPPPAGLDPGLGRPYGGYINWNSVGLSRLGWYYNTGPAPSGLIVCHNGYGSGVNLGNGTQCGTIGNNNTQVMSDGTLLTNVMQIDQTAGCRGDSGGPFTLASQETAVGIFSSLTHDINANCGSTLWITPVHIPIQAYSAYNFVLYGG